MKNIVCQKKTNIYFGDKNLGSEAVYTIYIFYNE